MMDKKINKCISLEQDVSEHIDSNINILNFSDWVNKQYKLEFMSEKYYLKELEKSAKRTQFLKDKLNEINHIELKIKLRPEEIKWLKNEAPARIKNYSEEGVFKFFCNLFKRNDLNRRQFKLLVERFGGTK